VLLSVAFWLSLSLSLSPSSSLLLSLPPSLALVLFFTLMVLGVTLPQQSLLWGMESEQPGLGPSSWLVGRGCCGTAPGFSVTLAEAS
jgi:hypothetical protein